MKLLYLFALSSSLFGNDSDSNVLSDHNSNKCCSQRLSIGVLGPFVGLPGLNARCNIPTTLGCRLASCQPRSPSVVDKPEGTDLADYEDSVQPAAHMWRIRKMAWRRLHSQPFFFFDDRR